MRRCSSPRPGITRSRGEQPTSGPGTAASSDHPLARGADRGSVTRVAGRRITPLARGAAPWYPARVLEVRITPLARGAVHGRHGAVSGCRWITSSRGAARPSSKLIFCIGITLPRGEQATVNRFAHPALGSPACAGSRTRSPSVTSTSWDHFARAGAASCLILALDFSGDHRSRGADMMDCFIISNSGDHPARAGSRMMGVPGIITPFGDHSRSRGEQWNPSTTRMMSIDHRSRGEQSKTGCRSRGKPGSPLAREQAWPEFEVGQVYGITARAGSSWSLHRFAR